MWKHKKHQKDVKNISLIDWCGLGVSAFIVAGFTAYALSLSFGPSWILLNSAPEESLALVAVAVSNNVGTGASRATEIPVMSPNDVSMAQNAIIRDAMDGEVFFSEHFRQLSEYEEVASIDIPSYLKGKSDKQEALEYYIAELTRHTEKAKVTVQTISAQALVHKNALQSNQTDIKNTQIAIEKSYNERNSTGIIDNIARLDEFVLVKQDHTYGQIFDQQVIKEYQSVIQFSEVKIQVLQANMPALVKGVTVNLPKWVNINTLEQLQIFSRTTP